jgi:hypothetical protein
MRCMHVSKLSLLEANCEPNGVYALFEEGEVVLEAELLVLDDGDEFDELVVLLFLLADVLLPACHNPYAL